MRPVLFVLSFIPAAYAMPAYADKYLAVTPSGAAEMLFGDKPEVVIGELSSKCIDDRWKVSSSTATELVCEAPLNVGQSILGQMLLGNSYSTPPRRFFRFNVAQINGISRVQASGWMELQMAFGQTKRTDFTGPQFQNSIMLFMASAGGKYPPGTTFPNHAALGVEVDNLQFGKDAAFRIKEVKPGSAAARADLRAGDIVTRIAGKHFRSVDDYLDATAKAAESPTYDIDILRDGKPMTLSVEREFRPVFTEQTIAKADTNAPPPTTVQLSVADEIQKLLDLKEKGIITQAEFDAQKKKLLGEK